MKLQKTFFILLILFISLQICFGQEKPKAELIDEFHRVPCDETLARVNNFVAELTNEPNSKGLVISFGKKEKDLQNLRYEQLIKNAVKVLRFDINHIIFAHGENEETLRLQLWKIPVGVDFPAFRRGEWSYSLAGTIKPYIYDTTVSNDDICPPTTDSELYSKLLFANSNFRGHLVIYTQSIEKFRQTKNELLKEIVDTYKVPRIQLKFFYIKSKADYFNIEYWLVPQKKK
jgi:hypothetical protein